MASSRQLHLLATRPAEMARFQRTGQLPRGIVPKSPLITLLEGISRRDLYAIGGLTIDERLGYSGSRCFPSAAMALRWLKPSPEVFGNFPAESWRMRSFGRPLSVTDLQRCCAKFPETLAPDSSGPAPHPLRKPPAP